MGGMRRPCFPLKLMGGESATIKTTLLEKRAKLADVRPGVSRKRSWHGWKGWGMPTDNGFFKSTVHVLLRLSKKEQARQAREEKIAKEARAVARAAGAANRKKLAKMKERHRLEMEEKRGAIARADSLARSSGAKGKRKRVTSPHVAGEDVEEDEEAGDANDESEISLSEGTLDLSGRKLTCL
eukprot:jgi/Phyca11/20090/fgenesh1_pg.PHYCAscaffold_57_\